MRRTPGRRASRASATNSPDAAVRPTRPLAKIPGEKAGDARRTALSNHGIERSQEGDENLGRDLTPEKHVAHEEARSHAVRRIVGGQTSHVGECAEISVESPDLRKLGATGQPSMIGGKILPTEMGLDDAQKNFLHEPLGPAPYGEVRFIQQSKRLAVRRVDCADEP